MIGRVALKLLCFAIELCGMFTGMIAAWGFCLFAWGPSLALTESAGVAPTVCLLVLVAPLMLLGFIGAHVALIVPIHVKRPDVAGRTYRVHLWLYRNCRQRLDQIEGAQASAQEA